MSTQNSSVIQFPKRSQEESQEVVDDFVENITFSVKNLDLI